MSSLNDTDNDPLPSIESSSHETLNPWINIFKSLDVSLNVKEDTLYHNAVEELSKTSMNNLETSAIRFRDQSLVFKQNVEKLAAENYPIFLARTEACHNVLSKSSDLSNANESLLIQIKQVTKYLHSFLFDAQSIHSKLKTNAKALDKHIQLLEIIELPQLMQTSIHNGHFDDALSILNHSRSLCEKHGSDLPVLALVYAQITIVRSLFVQQLCDQLRSQITLPVCIKTIVYLRRTSVFSEQELRLKFLQARTKFLMTQLRLSISVHKHSEMTNKHDKLVGFLPSNEPNYDVYWITTRYIEATRVHLFDILTQYRAVFPDEEKVLPHIVQSDDKAIFTKQTGKSMFQLSVLRSSTTNTTSLKTNLFHAWLIYQVGSFLKFISTSCDKLIAQSNLTAQEILDKWSKNSATTRVSEKLYVENLFTQLQSLISQAMNFGQSLSRLGCDFRPHLNAIFVDRFERFVKSYLSNAVNEFNVALQNLLWYQSSSTCTPSTQSAAVTSDYIGPLSTDTVYNVDEQIPQIFTNSPPLIPLYNRFCELFNGLYICCPLSLKYDLIAVFCHQIHLAAQSIVKIAHQLLNNDQCLTNRQSDDCKQLAKLFVNLFTPHILACLLNFLYSTNKEHSDEDAFSIHNSTVLNLCKLCCEPIFTYWPDTNLTEHYITTNLDSCMNQRTELDEDRQVPADEIQADCETIGEITVPTM